MDFGAILGAIWAALLVQNPLKTRLKKHLKNGCQKYRISVAYGNNPAPGLGKVRVQAEISCVRGANGNLQVIRELGYPKI